MNSPNPLSEQANPIRILLCGPVTFFPRTQKKHIHTCIHTILTSPQSPDSAPTNRILQKQQQKQAS